ncbi:hypothetical protein [Xylophilus ampelinus]|nr:hypothetical protein [Xylophilus ampelinus]
MVASPELALILGPAYELQGEIAAARVMGLNENDLNILTLRADDLREQMAAFERTPPDSGRSSPEWDSIEYPATGR